MKKAGIVVDDYKVTKFVSEITRAGFKEIKVSEKVGHPKFSVITVMYEEADLGKLAVLLRDCETYFKTRKN